MKLGSAGWSDYFYLSLSYLHCFVAQVYCEYWVLSLSVVRWMMCCCTLTLSRTGNTDWRIPFHSLGWRSGSFIKSSNVIIFLISNHISPFKFHGSSCAIKGAGSGGFWINYWPVFLPLFFLNLSVFLVFHLWFLLILQVSKPIIENVQYALRIEGTDILITLSARWVTLYCAPFKQWIISKTSKTLNV